MVGTKATVAAAGTVWRQVRYSAMVWKTFTGDPLCVVVVNWGEGLAVIREWFFEERGGACRERFRRAVQGRTVAGAFADEGQ